MPGRENNRLLSIDIVRGWVMVLMALDHCRELLYVNSAADPLDLATTSVPLFFTRWITHLCAPSFVFLSGVSAFISTARSGASNGNFLVKRGLWLVLLECTVVNFGIWFDIRFGVVLLQVIAAIGVGLVVLGLLIKAKVKPGYILAAGLLLLVLYPLVPVVNSNEAGVAAKVWMHLFQPGLVPLPGEHMLLVGYPPVPWLGIILAGYGCGAMFLQPVASRKRLFCMTGAVLLLAFVLLRITALYGDPAPWIKQADPLFTFLSFINVSKYPPSLQFDLLFPGIMFLLLYVAEKMTRQLAPLLAIFGQVPLFYYIIHWYIIHLLLFVVLFLQGFGLSDLSFGFNMGRPEAAASGLSLGAVYGVWLTVVLVLYPLCRRYGAYKQKWVREKGWLRYL